MKLLRKFAALYAVGYLAGMFAVGVLALIPTDAHADKVFYMRERWVNATKSGHTTGLKDSSWVWLKPCTGDNSVAFPVASSDTFYIDISDAAWNDPEFTNYLKIPSDSAMAGVQTQMARDSIPGVLNISFLPSVQNTDADSVNVEVAANQFGAISNNKFPWGIGGAGSTSNWQAITTQSLVDLSAVTHKEWTYSVSSYPLFRQLGTSGIYGVMVNSAISRTVLSRGVTLLRLIIGRRSTANGGTEAKYSIRVGYPAVSGLGETMRMSGNTNASGGVFYQRERWVGSTSTGRGNKDSSWVFIKPPNNLALSAVSAGQLADTFYVDVSDAAWNSPTFTKYVRWPSDTALASKSIYAAKDSLPALSLALISNVADADLDSISVTVATGLVGTVAATKAPWGTSGFALSSSIWNNLHGTGNATSFTTGQKILNFSVASPLWYFGWGSGQGPNQVVSRSVISRGITRFRVIAKCNSNDARTVANPKWALRVSYPAITGFGETPRASGE